MTQVCRFRCAGKVQKNYGSDVRGKCKRITLTLSSVLTYQCMYMYVCLCIMHGLRQRGQRATPPPLESGEVPPYSGHPRPVAYIWTSNLATHFKIASFAYCVCISRDIHGLQLVLYESLQLASSNFTGNCHDNGKLV